jgi:hypothetical protein
MTQTGRTITKPMLSVDMDKIFGRQDQQRSQPTGCLRLTIF